MRYRKFLVVFLAVSVVEVGSSLWLPGCTVNVGGGGITFSLLGGLFEFSFNSIGPITTIANQTVTVPTAVRLFEESPRETPPAAQMTLPSSSVGVARRLTAKTVVSQQTSTPSGSATIRFRIASGQSASLCNSAVLLAEYDMTLTAGVAAIVNEVFDLSQEAISILVANDVTICIEITADFDGDITIGEYFFAFGGGDAGNEPPSAIEGPAVLPGGLTQIPIDSRNGRAVAAPINRTILGVNYGVVGVLEAQTSAVTNPQGQPSTITVVPSELGLSTVETIIMGTHSSFVPDVSNGVTLATLTVAYTDGGSPATLDFVTGSTTAEWSHDRPEHTADFGGAQHGLAPVLYSFKTTLDSTVEYTAFSYSVSLPVDASRTIASLTLAMADTATLAGSRLATGDLAGWASQAITAITLAGQALVVSQTQACCLNDGSYQDISVAACIAVSGNAQGEGTACSSANCPTAGGNENTNDNGSDNNNDNSATATESCCSADGSCTDTEASVCTSMGGTPAGAGTSCSSTSCLGACCESDGSCTQKSVDQCDADGGEYQGFDVACGSDTCLGGCCFNDTLFCFGDISAADCIATGGQRQPSCDGTPCMFPCCQTDGTCTLGLTVNDCKSLGGIVNARGTTCDDVTCTPAAPTKWVLLDTQVNVSNSVTDFVRTTGLFAGSFTTFTETTNSIMLEQLEIEGGFENFNIIITSSFPTPASELTPGDDVVLTVTFSHSGTVVNFPPRAQFQYRVNESSISITPSTSYFYQPWSSNFDGTAETSYILTVPFVSIGGTLTITAFWWNCGECNVNWVYGPG